MVLVSLELTQQIQRVKLVFFNKADEDTLFNVFVSKRIKREKDPNKLLFEIEGLKTQADNKTYSASAELENLQGNGLSNARISEGSSANSEYENRDFVAMYRSKWKSAKPRFLPRNNDDPKKI